MVLMVLCTAIAAPIFASEYQTGSDSSFSLCKIWTNEVCRCEDRCIMLYFITVFVLGMTIHLTILNLAFGTECLKTSMQMLFSIIKFAQYEFGSTSVDFGSLRRSFVDCEYELCVVFIRKV